MLQRDTTQSEIDKVAEKWSATEYEPGLTFFGFPPLRPYRIRLSYGEQEVERYRDEPQWPELLFVDKYLAGRRVENVLSICCGFGHVERAIVQRLGGVGQGVRHCLGVDLAAGAVAEARRRGEAAGLGEVLEYRVADLNQYAWPEGAYDLIIANGALHHLSNLDTVLEGLRKALKPGGILYANEHVGASHQDYPPRQIELINAMAYLIPPELRPRRPVGGVGRVRRAARKAWGLIDGGTYVPDPVEKPNWSTPKKVVATALRATFPESRRRRTDFRLLHDSRKEHLLKTDPSEGVRSADIIPLMRAKFPQVEVRPYGGALLAYALDTNFYRKFEPHNPVHQRLLRLLCEIEEHFTASGDLGIEHAILVARP